MDNYKKKIMGKIRTIPLTVCMPNTNLIYERDFFIFDADGSLIDRYRSYAACTLCLYVIYKIIIIR